MNIEKIEDAIKNHSPRPKGIKVGTELYKEMVSKNKIKWKRGYIKGVIDTETDYPIFDENIFVHVDPYLDDYDFELPHK